VSIWAATKAAYPPDNYIAGVLVRAALNFFDIAIFSSGLVLLLGCTIVSYGVAFGILVRFMPAKAHLYAAAIVTLALAVYWLWLDHALHAMDRYYMRTELVVVTPILGLLAALYALRADGRPIVTIPFLPNFLDTLASRMMVRAMAGAFMLVMLVHTVETAKFVSAWSKYKAAVAVLATGSASDPSLGDPRFVSSNRISRDLSRLSWNSTTPFLSVIAANFTPARLVVDPSANYFWLSCKTATVNLRADRAVPAESRRLVQIHACLHR